MNTLEILEGALQEAEMIRARHDGVHAVHGYVCAIIMLRDFARDGVWGKRQADCFDETLRRLRQVDHVTS